MINLNFIFATIFLLAFSFSYSELSDVYNEVVISICLIIYYVLVFLCLRRKNVYSYSHTKWLTPEILFFLLYYFIFFYPYQLSLFGFFDLQSSKFLNVFFHDFSTKAVLLSTLGAYFFYLGSGFNFKIINVTYRKKINYKYMSFFLVSLLILFLLIFILTGLSNYLGESYKGSDVGTSAQNGVYFLVSHFVLMVFVFFIARYKQYSLRELVKDKILLFGMFIGAVWATFLLYIGDRNVFFILVISLLGGYFIFHSKLKFLPLFLVILIGIESYKAVEVVRTLDDKTLENISAVLLENEESSEYQSDGGSLYNTTITLRASIAYVESGGEYYDGWFKLVGFMGVVPFSRSLIVNRDQYQVTSADVLSDYVLGESRTWSLGTNIISDIYLDFGIPGVIVLMYMLGLVSKYFQCRLMSNHDPIHSISLYLIVLALWSETARYAYDFSIRNLIWSLLIFWIYKKIFSRSTNK